MTEYVISESQLEDISTRTESNPLGEGHGSQRLPLSWY